jgi:hypothetical protein
VEHIKGKAFLDSSIAVWYQGNPKPTDQYKRTTEYIKGKTGDTILPVRYWPDNRTMNGKIRRHYYKEKIRIAVHNLY